MSAPNPVLHTLYMVRALLQDVLEFEKKNLINLETHEHAAFMKMTMDIYQLDKEIRLTLRMK